MLIEGIAFGNVILRATSPGLIATTSDPFTHSLPMSLTFSTQPGTAMAGQTLTPAPVVTVSNDAHQIATEYAGTAQLDFIPITASAGATASGTQRVPVVQGVATFSDVQVTMPGLYRWKAILSTGEEIESDLFTVVMAPTKLIFTTQPGHGYAGHVLAEPPVVTVQDNAGNTATTFTGTVSLALKQGNGQLTGTTTVDVLNGIAVFRDVAVTQAGTDDVLTATSSALRAGDSTPFTIAAPYLALALRVDAPAITTSKNTLYSVTLDIANHTGDAVPSGTPLTFALTSVPLTQKSVTLTGGATLTTVTPRGPRAGGMITATLDTVLADGASLRVVLMVHSRGNTRTLSKATLLTFSSNQVTGTRTTGATQPLKIKRTPGVALLQSAFFANNEPLAVMLTPSANGGTAAIADSRGAFMLALHTLTKKTVYTAIIVGQWSGVTGSVTFPAV